MKKILLMIFVFFSLLASSQIANRLIMQQSFPQKTGRMPNFVLAVDTGLNGSTQRFRINPYTLDSLILPRIFNITGLQDSLNKRIHYTTAVGMFKDINYFPTLVYANSYLSAGNNTVDITPSCWTTLYGDTLYVGNINVPLNSLRPGVGISLLNNGSHVITIDNTAPDQTVAITSSGMSTVTGTYPNFDISTPSPILHGVGITTVTGTYPDYYIESSFTQTIQPIPPTTLVLVGQQLSTIDGNTVTLVTPTLTGLGTTTVTGSFPNYSIASTFNQTLQPIPASSLAINGNSLSIVGSNTVNLPVFTQTTQPVNLSLNSLSLSAGFNTVVLPAQVNQSLSIIGQTISLTNGGNVTIPTQTVPLVAGPGISVNSNTITNTNTLTSLTASTGISITNGSVITNASPNQIVSVVAGNGIVMSGSYPNFTVSIVTPTITVSNDIVVTGTWPNINISQYVPTTYTVTRSLMTGTTSVTFSISTRQASVDYNVNVDQSATLSSTQSMTVFAEYSTNGGSTWIGQDASRNSLTYGLSVTLGNVVGGTLKITGTIPGSALVRIRTTGTGTPTYVFGKETY